MILEAEERDARAAGWTDKDGRSYTGHDCTIDGRPATICGRLAPFAIVAELPHGLRLEYAWPTVARIMETRAGAFRS